MVDDEDDDESDDPLAKGIDSVGWMPTVVGARDVQTPKLTQKNSEFLPLFPLGGIVYTPNSERT